MPVLTCTLPPPSPDSVLERLDQFNLRVRRRRCHHHQQHLLLLRKAAEAVEESQITRQPPPPLPSSPPSPPAVAAPAPPSPTMHQNCISAELRQVAEACSFGYPQQHQQHQRQQTPQLEQHGSSSSSMSSALREVDLKGSLMDRLRLLESRILWLSLELESRNSSSNASSSTRMLTSTSSDSAWALPSVASSSVEDQKVMVPSTQRFTVEEASKRLGLGKRLQGCMPMMKKSKGPKQVLNAAEKKASGKCKEEKKRIERTRLYKRWFPVIGC